MLKYINNILNKSKQLIPKQQEGQTQEEYQRILKSQGLKYGAFALAVIALIGSFSAVTRNIVTVSNSVNGRELPIYCVETDKKQVALSFDAAWGNGRMRWL